MCDTANQGRQIPYEAVVVDADGGLANVIVQLLGSFAGTSAPTAPVLVDQVGCLYRPRVVGLQVGQALRVRNSDPGLHNVHGTSTGVEAFNLSQPVAGIVSEIRPEREGMLRLQCDVHSWMVAFVGVVNHPYFAITDGAGAFEIDDVPVGTQTIQAWHERFGRLTSSVGVTTAGVSDADFAYHVP